MKVNIAIIERLEKAGAIMLAKLSTGRLASDHRWYGGETKSPWNIKEHAGGSSAGSAAAVAAGLVAFSVGSETWGSIIQPCNQCGTTGLRPTFGRVSTYGAMTLSWSLDKVGPICRTVEDCAIVFNAIYGPDKKDQTLVDIPFNWNVKRDISKIRLGYTKSIFYKDKESKNNDNKTLFELETMGFHLIPIELPELSEYVINTITSCDAATFFEELTLNGIEVEPWSKEFRNARMIPAIEYIKAHRVRRTLMDKLHQIFTKVDVFITPTIDHTNNFWTTNSNYVTNMTGHPAVVVPNGFKENRMPTSVTFIGDLYKENETLLIAKKYQDSTKFQLQRPKIK